MIPFLQAVTEAYPFPIPSGPCQVVTIPANPQETRQTRRQLRTAAYCRVSTDDEEQLTSYQNQLQYFQEKILSNPDWSMVKVFADESVKISLTEFQRYMGPGRNLQKGLMRSMAFIRKKRPPRKQGRVRTAPIRRPQRVLNRRRKR